MSLFVNPAQFGPNEDFASYPRDTGRDFRLASEAGANLVFLPQISEVYPPDFDTWVQPGALSMRWEGERRPGHFRGVATVVLKLLQMVLPDRGYFGEKDYQQLKVVTKMVTDFNLPLEIVPCPTVRETSGLALSSRNAYLSDDGRRRAAVLYRALREGQRLAAAGERETEMLRAAMIAVIASEPAADLDYLAIVDPHTLGPVEKLKGGERAIAAMFFERVRLIDNVELAPAAS